MLKQFCPFLAFIISFFVISFAGNTGFLVSEESTKKGPTVTTCLEPCLLFLSLRYSQENFMLLPWPPKQRELRTHDLLKEAILASWLTYTHNVKGHWSLLMGAIRRAWVSLRLSYHWIHFSQFYHFFIK